MGAERKWCQYPIQPKGYYRRPYYGKLKIREFWRFYGGLKPIVEEKKNVLKKCCVCRVEVMPLRSRIRFVKLKNLFAKLEHHCNRCGWTVCEDCSTNELSYYTDSFKRVCDYCFEHAHEEDNGDQARFHGIYDQYTGPEELAYDSESL